MSSTINKTYIYQIYRRGLFLGVLQNVVSEFTYAQDINSAGASLSIEVDDTADKSREAVQPIQTEEGVAITTETGEILYTERSPDLVGNTNAKALIRNNNDILVYEVSSNYPNGKLVFSGFISRWRATFGSKDTIMISALSNGQELDNYLIAGAQTLDQSFATTDSSASIYDQFAFGDKGAGWNKNGQTFTVGVGTNLAAILVRLASPTGALVTVTVTVWNSVYDYFSGTPLTSVSRDITSATPADYTFTFPSAIPVNVGQQYFFSVTSPTGTVTVPAAVYYNAAGGYTGGDMQNSNYAGGSGGGSWGPYYSPYPTIADLYFKTYYTAGATNSPFNSQDPTTMLRTIIDSYVAAGGTINYGSGTTVLTNLTKSYTFKVNTVLEGIKKILDLAPSNFFWYVDPATNTIYFKSVSTTADINLILGRHIESLDVEASVEEVKTNVYFTGGDVGGNVNLFINVNSATALAANAGRTGLARITDNRVTLSDTGSTLANNFLSENDAEFYHTSVVVNDSTMDTNLITLGQVVGFEGFGNFVDTLLLLVVRIERHPDNVTLTLGAIPQRATSQVEEIQRRLNEVETLYNPSVAS